eukprot:TRINITY_DN15786_c0_g1_i1.p1 TRINITY_DN15786_c0_g1~~TRINITY_DN15786_c0_g1_i1.p1  ORF type:complete len:712 (+),score=347.28 TRINITY_DN15786_c0_g1_i1:54-2138(+)
MQNKLEERMETESVHMKETEGMLTTLTQRHSEDKIALLRRHEVEVYKVKEYLETQLEQLNGDTARMKAEHAKQLQVAESNRAEAVAVAQSQRADVRAVMADHDAHLANLKARQADELGKRQAQTMQFMHLQEEELERVRTHHQRQQRDFDMQGEREVSDLKQRQLLAKVGSYPPQPYEGLMRGPRPVQPDDAYKVPPLSQFSQTTQASQALPSQPTAVEPPLSLGLAPPAPPQLLHVAQPQQQQAVSHQAPLHPETSHALTHLQQLEAEAAQRRQTQDQEYQRLLTLHQEKREDYDRALDRLKHEHECRRDAERNNQMREDEIRQIKERTEQDFANRIQLQQMHEQERDLSDRLMTQERQMSVAMSQYEKEIARKEMEVQQVRIEMQKKENDLRLQDEALRHKDRVLQEKEHVMPQLQEKLRIKEAELSTLLSNYNLSRLEMARSIDNLKGELSAENRKAEQMRQHIADLNSKLSQKQDRLAALESDLHHEKKRSDEALRNAEALKPEIDHWRRTAETNTTTQHVLEDQIRMCQEVNDREIRMRDRTIMELRGESDELRAAVAHLTEMLTSSQKSVEDSHRKDLQNQSRFEDLQGQVRDAEAELRFTSQALETVSSRNQELERMHMQKVVDALDRKIFGEGETLPMHPSRAAASLLESKQFSDPFESASRVDQDRAYAPVIDTLAKYIKTTGLR